jgi:hypothetical protein
MNRQVNGQSKFSNFTIWNVQKNKSMYTHLFRHAFTLLKFYDFIQTSRLVNDRIDKGFQVQTKIKTGKQINPNDMKYMLFGKLCYTDKRKDREGNTYVWFYTENKPLYTPFYKFT